MDETQPDLAFEEHPERSPSAGESPKSHEAKNIPQGLEEHPEALEEHPERSPSAEESPKSHPAKESHEVQEVKEVQESQELHELTVSKKSHESQKLRESLQAQSQASQASQASHESQSADASNAEPSVTGLVEKVEGDDGVRSQVARPGDLSVRGEEWMLHQVEDEAGFVSTEVIELSLVEGESESGKSRKSRKSRKSMDIIELSLEEQSVSMDEGDSEDAARWGQGKGGSVGEESFEMEYTTDPSLEEANKVDIMSVSEPSVCVCDYV